MKKYEFKSLDIEAFKDLFKAISHSLNQGDVVCLYGNLGAGKTQAAKYMISNLIDIDDEAVSSPTFNIVQTYKSSENTIEIWHFDLYRVQNVEELVEIGVEEAFENAISIIEWPEIAEVYLPENRINIFLHFSSEQDKRDIEIASYKWLKL